MPSRRSGRGPRCRSVLLQVEEARVEGDAIAQAEGALGGADGHRRVPRDRGGNRQGLVAGGARGPRGRRGHLAPGGVQAAAGEDEVEQTLRAEAPQHELGSAAAGDEADGPDLGQAEHGMLVRDDQVGGQRGRTRSRRPARRAARPRRPAAAASARRPNAARNTWALRHDLLVRSSLRTLRSAPTQNAFFQAALSTTARPTRPPPPRRTRPPGAAPSPSTARSSASRPVQHDLRDVPVAPQRGASPWPHPNDSGRAV